MTPEEAKKRDKLAEEQYKRLRQKLSDAKTKLGNKNPLKDNPPAIQGDDRRKHGTWGQSRNKSYEGRHKK